MVTRLARGGYSLMEDYGTRRTGMLPSVPVSPVNIKKEGDGQDARGKKTGNSRPTVRGVSPLSRLKVGIL